MIKKIPSQILSIAEYKESLDIVKQKIYEIEKTGNSNLILDTSNKIDDLFPWRVFYSQKIVPSYIIRYSQNKGIYRACSIDYIDDIYNPKMYEMRPQKPEIPLMRCNLPGTSLFYGASDSRTAIFEKLLSGNINKINVDIAITKWIILKDDLIKLTAIDIDEILMNSGHLNIQRWQTIEKEYFKTFLSFFSNLFLSDQRLLTAWFSEKHFKIYKTDLISYPSFNTKGSGINYAISPSLITNNNIKLKSVIYLNVSIDESEKLFHVNSFDKLLFYEGGKLINSNSKPEEIRVHFESDLTLI